MYQEISLSRLSSRREDELFVLLRDSLLLPKSPNLLAQRIEQRKKKAKNSEMLES